MPPSSTARARRRPLWRVLAALIAATLLLAAPASAGVQDPSLEQEVDADEETVGGRTVMPTGHVDLGPRFIDGVWRLQARDDREAEPVWRFPNEVVFQLTNSAQLAAPDNPDFDFLDVDAGHTLYVVPQTQDPQVVWLGWNTQDPEVTERIDRGATLTLQDIDGPGELFLFLQEGVAGPPNVLWDTTEDLPQDLWMEVNTHTHANWVFTEPGTYRLAVEMHADLLDGDRGSDVATLRFAVGNDVDPESVFDLADLTQAAEATGAAPEAAEENPPASQTDTATFSVVVIGVLVGGLLLGVVVIGWVVTGRRTRAAAERADDPEVTS